MSSLLTGNARIGAGSSEEEGGILKPAHLGGAAVLVRGTTVGVCPSREPTGAEGFVHGARLLCLPPCRL